MSHISDHIAHASVHLEFVYCIFAGQCMGHNFSEWAVSFFGVPLMTRPLLNTWPSAIPLAEILSGW